MTWAQTIGLALRRDDPVPVGLQLEWGLRSAILTGQLAFGERLPGLRELAEEVGVNVNTARAVYGRLETDGLVETRHGAGSFVSHRPAGDQLNWLEARTRAEQAARQSGLTPQQLAAALYVAPPLEPADAAAVNRRSLRVQIAVLEEALSDLRAQHPELAADPPEPERGRGPRLLGERELVAARDVVLAKLVDAARILREQQEPPAAPAPEKAARERTPGSLGIAPA